MGKVIRPAGTLSLLDKRVVVPLNLSRLRRACEEVVHGGLEREKYRAVVSQMLQDTAQACKYVVKPVPRTVTLLEDHVKILTLCQEHLLDLHVALSQMLDFVRSRDRGLLEAGLAEVELAVAAIRSLRTQALEANPNRGQGPNLGELLGSSIQTARTEAASTPGRADDAPVNMLDERAVGVVEPVNLARLRSARDAVALGVLEIAKYRAVVSEILEKTIRAYKNVARPRRKSALIPEERLKIIALSRERLQDLYEGLSQMLDFVETRDREGLDAGFEAVERAMIKIRSLRLQAIAEKASRNAGEKKA